MIRILIVEDDWASREGLQFLFADEPDFEVIGVAKEGREALDFLAMHLPDVVVLDVNLPGGVSGIQIAEEIHAHNWPTRILAYSAYSDTERVQAMVEAGALGYYVKGGGNSQADMVCAVRKVAAGEVWAGKGLEDWMVQKLALDEEGKITTRQSEILLLVEQGLSNKEISTELGLEKRTVDFHLERIFKRLGVHNRVLACRVARERGWLK